MADLPTPLDQIQPIARWAKHLEETDPIEADLGKYERMVAITIRALRATGHEVLTLKPVSL